MVAERIDLVTCVGNMSYNLVSGSQAKQGLASETLRQFTALLKQESNEAAIVHSVSQMALWCKFTSSPAVSDELLERLMVSQTEPQHSRFS